jgi:RNA polymerase sigma-70 factor (ECF subfamily)
MRGLLRTRSFSPHQPLIGGDDDLTAADDRTLVARARVDRAVFAELYRRYVDGVYWYCLGRLREAALAEDATSQVFAQALAALLRYRDHERETAFRAWLFRIAHNVVVDAVRARHGHESLAAAVDLVDDRDLPEEVVILDEAQCAVWDLVATLPPEQRSVVELRLVGLTGMKIATVLGRSRGAVDTAQSRAVARLRTLMRSSQLPGLAETADDGSQ